MDISNFIKDNDVKNYYEFDNIKLKDIDNFFNYLKNKSSWNKNDVKKSINKLYVFKKIAANSKIKKYNEKIDFYIDYLKYVKEDLESLHQNIFSMIGTIFIPLSFIVGFFGMNFKSMGVPTLKDGILTLKLASHKLAIIFFIIITSTIYFYIYILQVF